MMRTMTFRKVKYTATAFVDVDGKKLRRQRTFWQTENPFNRNADGFPKTRQEIFAELVKEGDAWAATLTRTSEPPQPEGRAGG